jgi:hypothetical protein
MKNVQTEKMFRLKKYSNVKEKFKSKVKFKCVKKYKILKILYLKVRKTDLQNQKERLEKP